MRNFGTIALGFALAGCASEGTQVAVRQAPQFQKGVSTKADVVAALGEPNATFSKAKGTTTIAYWNVTARPNAADFVALVGAGATTVSFRFGHDGKLLDYGSSTANSNAHASIVN